MTASTDTEPRGLRLDLYRTKSFGANPKCNLLHAVEEVTVTEIHYADGRKVPMPKGSRVLPATVERPAVALVQRGVLGKTIWHIQPLPDPGWTMAGGTYAASSDSRVGKIIEFYGAISVHDWSEKER